MSGGWTADGAGARRWEDAMVVLQHVLALFAPGYLIEAEAWALVDDE
jgi:hypothetical protein